AGVEDIIADSKRIVAYPNPVAAGETITLMLPGDGETKVEFYNLSGALVASIITTDSDVVTVPTTGLAPGEYLLRAVRNNETHTTIIIIN
ncbi:MAG: T9SS type A sorting domain-containing protein, partial [Muribaculaceae bacterium]|nr:T9SS type A sorting domain-containing protein [Muribaculaceae bacterium]